MISGPGEFQSAFNVSRETIDKLRIYETKLNQWQKAVNLVAPKTLPDVWHRHFADSAQLFSLLPEGYRSHVDLGSGGGFPGMVLAILAQGRGDAEMPRTTLIESDQRKAAFLREVARAVDNPAEVISTRIEMDASVHATGAVDIVTARALAPLIRLFELTRPFCHESTVCVFPKGRTASDEVVAARAAWAFDLELVPSRTDDEGRIAMVRGLRPSDKG